MLKFFRKHNKKLLAIFMALLLVVWLGGSALTSMIQPDYSARLIATTRFGDLTNGEVMRVQNLTSIWNNVPSQAGYGLPWDQPLGPSGPTLTVADWAILLKEAHRAGFVPRRVDGEEYFVSGGMSQRQINTIANRMRLSREQLFDAVAEYLTVLNAASIIQSAAVTVSEAETRVAARNAKEEMKLEFAVLSTDAFVDPDAEFSEQELQEFFEMYREQEPGRGMEFGYFLPPKVKVQYIKIDTDKIKENLRLPERNLLRKAKTYWKENRRDPAFMKRPKPPGSPESVAPSSEPPQLEPDEWQGFLPPEGGKSDAPQEESAENNANEEPTDEWANNSEEESMPPTSPVGDADSGDAPLFQPGEEAAQPAEPEEQPETADDTAAAVPQPTSSLPAVSPPRTPAGSLPSKPVTRRPEDVYYQSFSEVKDIAIDLVRQEEASRRANRIAEYLVGRLIEPWLEMPFGEDNYHVTPEGVEAEDYYRNIIEELPPQFQYPGAVSVGTTDWFSAEEATSLPDIGQASLHLPTGAVYGFYTLAFQVQGLAELPRDADVDRSLYLAELETSSLTLQDREDNYYLFRVIATEPAHAPESLDEVRDQVMSDLRRQKAWDQAKEEAAALARKANEVGLEESLAEATELRELDGVSDSVFKPAPIVRQPMAQYGLSRPMLPQIGFLQESFVDEVFSLDPAEGEHPTAVIEVPERSLVAVVEAIEFQPMTRQEYADARLQAKALLARQRMRQVQMQWFDPDLIHSRNRVDFVNRDTEDEEESEGDDSESTSPTGEEAA